MPRIDNMFGPSKRLRQLALRVLVLWMLALVTSMVHACLVAPGLAAYGASGGGGQPAASGAPGHQHGAHGSEHRHGTPETEKAACLKFCSEESASAPAGKQKFDPAPTAALAPPLAEALPTVASVTGGVAAGQFVENARPPLSIAIAFLRLTL